MSAEWVRIYGGRTRVSIALLVGGLSLLLGVGGSAAAGSGATASATTTFSFTGGEQIFEVPDGVTSLDVLAVGGKGSPGTGDAAGAGGFGAAMTGKLAVTPGQTLFIEVGGNGGGAFPLGPGAGSNGGGSGAVTMAGGAGGGGGASDIRTISRAGAGDTLGSRLIIAGGGGGGGGGAGFGSNSGGAGGRAGGLPGSGNGSNAGDGGGAGGGVGAQGATQTGGGLSVFDAGELGTGGDGGPSTSGGGYGGGGGGGGKFGGGGGGTSGGGGGGGGGGSTSFAVTATNTSFQTDTTGVPLVRLTYQAGGANNSGLKFGKVKLNKQKGTATLPVTVPGSGTLSVGGKGVVKKRPQLDRVLGALAKEVTQAGEYKLKVKAKGKKKAKLFDTGKVKVKAVVTFKPTSGDKVSESKRIRLKKN